VGVAAVRERSHHHQRALPKEVYMELAFVVVAVRRYWWTVVLGALIGLLAGQQVRTDEPTVYESTALVLVSEPTSTWVDAAVADRYLLGQLSVLRSSSLAADVAARLGGNLDAAGVQQRSTMRQVADTDVIEIEATADAPELATAIADRYLDAYFATLQQRIDEAEAPGREQLEAALADVQGRLDEANATIAALLAPYLAVEDEPIPTLDQLDPALATRRQLLLQEYERVALALDDFELGSQARSASQVIQSASVAEARPGSSATTLSLAVTLTGLLMGVVVACVLAATTQRVLDQRELAELLGVSLLGAVPRVHEFTSRPRSCLEDPPARVIESVERLVVQAESRAHLGESLTVVVVGAVRGSGTTTLAALVANRLAATGSSVLLVDADPRDNDLTRTFGADPHGLASLVAAPGRGVGPRRLAALDRRDPSVATAVPGVRVVGAGGHAGRPVLRRQHVPDLLEAATRLASIVVVDAGPILAAASSTQLAQLADAVVLAVPRRRLVRRILSAVAAQLVDRRDDLLVVVVPARRRRDRPSPPAVSVVERPMEILAPPDVEARRAVEVGSADRA
jgi:Mrp family chromosome partitioning ATPase